MSDMRVSRPPSPAGFPIVEGVADLPWRCAWLWFAAFARPSPSFQVLGSRVGWTLLDQSCRSVTSPLSFTTQLAWAVTVLLNLGNLAFSLHG